MIIALPTIQHELNADLSALQWTATGYTLAFALTLITGGRLGDRFGHRVLFVAGTAGFGASSLLAGCAPNLAVLLAAQGLFAGLMVPQVLSFIHVAAGAAGPGLRRWPRRRRVFADADHAAGCRVPTRPTPAPPLAW